MEGKQRLMRILCRHVLKVFMMKNVQDIPPQYVLKRWTRRANRQTTLTESGGKIMDDCNAILL